MYRANRDKRELTVTEPAGLAAAASNIFRRGMRDWTIPAMALIFTGASMLANTVLGQQSSPLNKDFEEKPWEEQKQQLPKYPKESDLKQIDVGPNTSFQFFVDTESINVGTDGVVRFTLVARSASGASNVSFEGLRCDTQERKIYALGRADATWLDAKNPKWTVLARRQVNPVYSVLYDDFFCPERIVVSSTREAVDSIKNGGNFRARTRR